MSSQSLVCCCFSLRSIGFSVLRVGDERQLILTGGVPRHLDDALAVLPNFSGVEGPDPHRHLDRGRSHGASGWGGVRVDDAATARRLSVDL